MCVHDGNASNLLVESAAEAPRARDEKSKACAGEARKRKGDERQFFLARVSPTPQSSPPTINLAAMALVGGERPELGEVRDGCCQLCVTAESVGELHLARRAAFGFH